MYTGTTPQTTVLNKFPDTRILAKLAVISLKKQTNKQTISAKLLWRNILLRGKLLLDAKISNFEMYESTSYMIPLSMPSTK